MSNLTLMAVHAHPDDEASSTGGVLARYASEGITTVLVTCTDGGCGDGPGGVKPGQEGHDPGSVVALRRTELEASCAVLGVKHLEMLSYRDSGMDGWPQNDAPGAFWGTPVEEGASRLAALIEQYQPDVIVTYDENGFYGHPDHIQAHRITMAAVAATGSGAKVYWTTVPKSAFAHFQEVMAEFAGPDAGAGSAAENPEAEPMDLGLPDDEITTWVDCTSWAGQKFDSLAAHASQGDNIFFLGMGRDRFAEFLGVETFVRVDAGATAGLHEDDLFAGRR